jgi:hypothetical protein
MVGELDRNVIEPQDAALAVLASQTAPISRALPSSSLPSLSVPILGAKAMRAIGRFLGSGLDFIYVPETLALLARCRHFVLVGIDT